MNKNNRAAMLGYFLKKLDFIANFVYNKEGTRVLPLVPRSLA